MKEIQETSKKLNNKQFLAAQLIAQGERQKDVAQKIKVSQETISIWKQNKEFEEATIQARIQFLNEMSEWHLCLIESSYERISHCLQPNTIEPYQAASIALKFLSTQTTQHNLSDRMERMATSIRKTDEQSQEISRNIMSIMDQVFDLKRKGEETSDEEFERVAERVGWTPDWDMGKE